MLHKFWLNIRLFFDGAILSYKALFRWMRPSTYLASKVVFPFGQIMFFGLLGSYAIGGGNPSFFVIGNAIQVVAMSGIYGVSMSRDGSSRVVSQKLEDVEPGVLEGGARGENPRRARPPDRA